MCCRESVAVLRRAVGCTGRLMVKVAVVVRNHWNGTRVIVFFSVPSDSGGLIIRCSPVECLVKESRGVTVKGGVRRNCGVKR